MQNLVVTLTGSGLGFVIGFAFTPIIARIYPPEAYGLFALFNALASNITLISTFSLTNAFILPDNKFVFYSLFRITLVCILLTSLFSFLVFWMFGDTLFSLFNAEALSEWVLLVPVFVIFSALGQAFNAWNVRIKGFVRSAGSKATSVTISKSITLTYGYLSSGSIGGLILGEFVNVISNTMILLGKNIRKELFNIINWKVKLPIRATLYEYSSYPKFAFPANWLYSFADQLPIYAITAIFTSQITGYFSFAYSLLSIPLLLIGQSAATVFLQKAAETEKIEPERLKEITLDLYNKMLYAGLLPFALITIFGDLIFSWFLGSQWLTAGIYAGYLGPYFMFRLISSPILSIYRVKRRERTFLYFTLSHTFLLALSLLYGFYTQQPDHIIILYSVVAACSHLTLILIIFKMLKIENAEMKIFKSIFIVFISFTLVHLFRYFLFK